MTASHVNWRKVEAAYRAGILTLAEIARQAGLGEAAIRRRAKKDGWARDLTARVRARTSQKLIMAMADGQSEGANQPHDVDKIVEQAAMTQVAVVREHSRAIRSGMDLTARLMRELEVATTKNDELLDAIESEKDEKKRAAAERAVSLSSRATVMRDLAQAARLWIQLERQAFRISDERDRNQASAINEMTEDELERSIIEDLRVLNLVPLPAPEPETDKPKGVVPRSSRDK